MNNHPATADPILKPLLAGLLLFGIAGVTLAQTQVGADIDGEAADDHSGNSVSLSADGSRLAVGAYRNDGGGADSGHVRVHDWDGSSWTQIGADIDGEAAGDVSGWSVALSADGSRLAVGAISNAGNGFASGHVRVHEWNGSSWTQLGADIDGEAAGDESGRSVSLSADGSRLAVGARLNDGNGTDSGHTRVYEWNGSNWTQIGADIDGEAAGDQSGFSVSLSADGSRLAVGAFLNDGNGADSGHVRVHEWNGSSWTQLGADIDSEVADDYSGEAISLSADGSRVAIGARFNDGNGVHSGHTRVYEWNGSNWTQLGADIDGETAGDRSGQAVSLSANGSRVAIGTELNDGNGADSGHARVFDWDGSSWTQVDADIDGEAADDRWGVSVSLSADGGRLASGAVLNDDAGLKAGHARVYDLSASGPELSIAPLIPAAELETVDVDVALTTNGQSIAATTFSIDYDESCLSFDDTDGDADNIPDNLAFNLPAGFSVTAFHDLGDTDGEIDISIADLAPPIATLPDDTVVTITFTSTCSPALGATIIAPVSFSSDPSATFSDDLAVDVDGSTTDGSIEIWPGPRGDCNGTGLPITAADLIADVLEIFDGDGTFWADVPGSTFLGSPVGCDANDDTTVDAGDISCTILLIFGDTCGGGSRLAGPGLDMALDPMSSPLLGLKGARRGERGTLWIPVVFSAGRHSISSVAFSLDLVDKGLAFDPFDGDGDGIPDAIRFPKGGRPDLIEVRYDAADRGGELDLVFAQYDATFADGLLLEVAVRPLRPSAWRKLVRFAKTPAASFGNTSGQAVAGQTVEAGRK